jgi:predicted secreted protein
MTMVSVRMLRRVLAGLVQLPLCVAVAAILAAAPGLARAAAVKVTDTDMGKEVKLAPGDTLEITLDSPSNPAYSWQVFEYNSGIIKEVGTPVFAPDKSKPGGGGETTIEFAPTSAGQSSIDLRYVPSQGASATTAPAKVYSITVTVKPQSS